jgi:hypothetical protein
VGQALEVLTVEFSNATLGSQSSKHAEAFRRGQKMAAVADVANIVLEEVSTGRHLMTLPPVHQQYPSHRVLASIR